jgi:hypothetical protein
MRQRFAKGLGGTLRCSPPELRTLGTPTAATVTLKTAGGLDLPTPVVDQLAAIDADGRLSFVLTPGNTPDPITRGYLYRAVWSYTIEGVGYQVDQTYEVNARLLKPTLSLDDVTPQLPAAWEELLDGGSEAAETAIAIAWNDLLDDLSARGYRPDKILDPDRLFRPHRSKVIANLYGSFGPQWMEAANRAERVYGQDLEGALVSLDWYDATPDNKRAADEQVKTPTIVCTR